MGGLLDLWRWVHGQRSLQLAQMDGPTISPLSKPLYKDVYPIDPTAGHRLSSVLGVNTRSIHPFA